MVLSRLEIIRHEEELCAKQDALAMILICQKLIKQFEQIAIKYPNLADDCVELIIEEKHIIKIYRKDLGL